MAILRLILLTALLLVLGTESHGGTRISRAKLLNLLKYARTALARSPVEDHKPHLNYSEQVTELALSITEHFFDDFVYTVERPDQVVPDQVRERKEVDFMMILDSSASLGSENFEKAIKVLVDWVDILDEEDFNSDTMRVSLMTYSEPDKVYHEIPFKANQNKETIKADIQDTDYHNGSSTSTEVALWKAYYIFKQAAREDATRVILLVTDGWSHNPLSLPFGVLFPVAKLRRLEECEIFVVGVGDQINHNELVAIANKPSSQYLFEADNYSMMEDVLAAVREELEAEG